MDIFGTDFNTRDYETKPLGSRNRSYSREEANQAPNQWWDFLDLFSNVPERRIENPQDYDWAKRDEQVQANYTEDGSFVAVPKASFTSYNIPRYTKEGVLYWTTRKDTDPNSSTYGQPIPDVKEYNQNRPWYRSLPYGLGGEKQGDMSDYALASFIFNEGPGVISPFVALKTAKPKTQNIVMKGKYEEQVTIPLNKQGLKDARILNNALSKDIDTIQNLSRFNTRFSKEFSRRSSSKYWYQDSEIALRKGGITDPDGTGVSAGNVMYSTGVDPTINWNKYGYTPGTEPTQVRNVTIPELKTQVANSLDAFYQKTQEVVQSRVGSKASSSQIKEALKNQPQYWTNPVTQKIYRVAWKGGLSKRYTLKPINRQYLEKQQSTGVQKQIAGQYQKGLQKKNVDLKQAHDDKYKILSEELSSVQDTIADYNKRGIRGSDYDAAILKQNDLNTQINNLEEGRWYTEHNVYLQSEKARNYVLDNSGTIINDSSEFQLGNIANQTPRLENLKNPDTLVFRNLKNNLERVLDETSYEYFSYPNYIVNSNPRLSGGREGIIRIEHSPIEWQQVPGSNPPIMRPVLTDFKVKGGILSGKSVIEIDTKDLDFIKNNLNTTEDVQNWLSKEHGINPVAQSDSFPREGFQIRLSKSPVKSTKVQIKEFKKLIEDVQAGRKTWAEVFAEEGIEIVPQTEDAKVKGKGGRPKGSPNKVKGEKGGNLLNILFPDRNL